MKFKFFLVASKAGSPIDVVSIDRSAPLYCIGGDCPVKRKMAVLGSSLCLKTLGGSENDLRGGCTVYPLTITRCHI